MSKTHDKNSADSNTPEALQDGDLDVSGGLYVYTPEVKKTPVELDAGDGKGKGSKSNSCLELPY